MQIGNKDFNFTDRPIIMGILNVTPDSFSDGGKYNTVDAALFHVEEMIKEGAEIIDVGGESTRPGYTYLDPKEESDRVVPVIRAIKSRFDIPISLDTYKSEVAKIGADSGCDMINDIWGLKLSRKLPGYMNDGKNTSLAEVVKEFDLPICIMHNSDSTEYDDFLNDMLKDIKGSISIAKKAGIKDEKIILDPGIGFGKTYEQNLCAIKHVDCLCELGYPVLLGTSRKSVIGLTLDVGKDDRMVGTVATTVMGLERGCAIFRVHDVKENFWAIRMAKTVMNA